MSPRVTPFGPFELDHEGRRVTRYGKPVGINERGVALLEVMLAAAGEAVTKEALLEGAWPGVVTEEGNLTVQISTLRRTLGDEGNAMIVTVPRVGYRLVSPSTPAMRPPSPVHRGPPLIAVLPFDNHGQVSEDGYFADGVVDDIITALSRFTSFTVLSRGASFAMRGRRDRTHAAGSELGARYVLDGSIRRMGDRLRVTAQLSDLQLGSQLWAEKYDGTASDIFSFQDSITESVVGRIEPTIRRAEIERVRRKPTENLDAYDLFLRAMPLIHAPGIEGHVEALTLLQKATELDPGYALAHAYTAWVYEKRFSFRGQPIGNRDTEQCIELARLAMRLGGHDPLVRAIGGYILYRVADEPTGLMTLRQAAADNPNSVSILQLAGVSVGVIHGNIDEGYAYCQRAYTLSPGSPEAYQFLQAMGSMELMRGNIQTAIDLGLRVLATSNDWLFTYILLTAAYAISNRMDEAQTMLRRLLELNPRLTIERLQNNLASEHAFAEVAIPGLRKAGLPER